MKFHIHIFQVVAKAEMDIDDENAEIAQQKALDKAKAGELSFGTSECEYLSVSFIVPPKEKTD